MNSDTDSYRLKGLRQQMVSDLKRKGVSDPQILAAFSTIPRHCFLDEAFAEWAYRDTAFPIGAGQTISQPSTVAQQTALLGVKKKDVILEVGTGSGYQACVLASMGAKVYTIERQEELFMRTSRLLTKIGFNHIRTLLGDGYQGAERFAPFDKILVTAACHMIPKKLISQLKDGGTMVIPVNDEVDNQKMMRIVKNGDRIEIKEHGHYKFVPMLSGIKATV